IYSLSLHDALPIYLTNYDLTREVSLHLDFFSQIRRNVEIFTFDNSWLAFFKSTAVDRLELQDFLFGLYGFFSGHFFLFWRRRFSPWRAHGRRLRRVDNLE